MIRFAALLALMLAAPAHAAIDPFAPTAAPEVRYRQDRISLRLTPDAARRLIERGARAQTRRLALAGVDRTADRLGVTRFTPEFRGAPASPASPLTSFWYADLAPGVDPLAAAESFASLTEIASAQPIAIVPVTAGVPDDSLWSAAWHLYQPSRHDIGALEAWDATTGDSAIALGVIDTGVLLDHPDLEGQIWRNDAEAGGIPGVDDDGNGYVDDVRGWDFVSLASSDEALPLEDWRDQDNDPDDFAGHGTAVSGLAAARTNNGIGVAGLAWDIRIMPLRVGWAATSYPLGLVDLSAAAEAIAYATANGASVLNCSFATLAQEDLLAAVDAALAAGVTVVFSSGNNGSPAAVSIVPNLISVAASDQNDKVTLFSNVGPNVSLSAPGLSLPTTFIRHAGGDSVTDRQPTYTTGASGTSFAAPLVAGAAALVQSRRRALGLAPLAPLDMKLRLMESATDIDALNDRSGFGSGRLNAGAALSETVRSFHLPAGSRSVGPAVVVPALRGETRIAFAMSSGEILFIGATSRDTLLRVPLPARPDGTMAAADAGTGTGTHLYLPMDDGRIFACDLQGRPVPGWPVNGSRARAAGWAAPVLADLDADGVIEVTWCGEDGQLRAWHTNGAPVAGFPRSVAQSGSQVVLAAANLDDEPGAELIAAGGVGTIFAIDGDGSLMPGWPQALLTYPDDVIVADLEGDGHPEVVCAAGTNVSVWTTSAQLRFSRTMPTFATGLAAADFDGDGGDEVVVAMLDRLGVFDATGLFRPGWPRYSDGFVDGPPVVGGLSRLAPRGIMVSHVLYSDLHRLHGFTQDGKRLARYPLPGGAGGPVVLADIDGDGATEIVAGTGRDSALWVYDAGDGSWADPAWPEPGASPARTRCAYGAPALSPLDDVPPEPVADLGAERIAPRRVEVRWSRPADEGPSGHPSRYELAISATPFAPGAFDQVAMRRRIEPSDAARESVTIDDLPVGSSYYFALRAEDAAGNVSVTSNLAALEPVPSIASGLALAPLGNPCGLPVDMRWFAAASVGGSGRALLIFDVTGRMVARLEVPAGVEGLLHWDGRDRAGRLSGPGLYFARLSAPGHAVTARLVIVE